MACSRALACFARRTIKCFLQQAGYQSRRAALLHGVPAIVIALVASTHFLRGRYASGPNLSGTHRVRANSDASDAPDGTLGGSDETVGETVGDSVGDPVGEPTGFAQPTTTTDGESADFTHEPTTALSRDGETGSTPLSTGLGLILPGVRCAADCKTSNIDTDWMFVRSDSCGRRTAADPRKHWERPPLRAAQTCAELWAHDQALMH